MYRLAKIGSILINKKQKKVNTGNRSVFNSALRASLGSVAFRKGPYRTNSGTTSVQTRLATRWHGSVTFICTVTPRLRKLKSGSNKDALMWTGSCLVPVRRSLRKHPFLLALRRCGRFARRNVCDSATEIPYSDDVKSVQNPVRSADWSTE